MYSLLFLLIAKFITRIYRFLKAVLWQFPLLKVLYIKLHLEFLYCRCFTGKILFPVLFSQEDNIHDLQKQSEMWTCQTTAPS